MPAEKTPPLRPRLEEARKALDDALEEACEIDVGGADLSDVMRLEEQLTVAREAASNVIAALRRLGPERSELNESAGDTHRVFVDDRGVRWDAFAVHPSRPRGRETLPPPYDTGWLAIQCPEGVRRVTPIPEGWRECSRDEFCRLLENAAVTPRRTT
ncbi:MAG: hypothetical protein ACREOK_14040 [Gemmatimonadaceae bacterium]